jgi:hypothetical protein
MLKKVISTETQVSEAKVLKKHVTFRGNGGFECITLRTNSFNVRFWFDFAKKQIFQG